MPCEGNAEMRHRFSRKCRLVREDCRKWKLSVFHSLTDIISADTCPWDTSAAVKAVRNCFAVPLLYFEVTSGTVGNKSIL